jgi:uncharacterized membrane protein YoaT (DUF817 family)
MAVIENFSKQEGAVSEFGVFILKQIYSCAFAGPFLALILISSHVKVAHLSHYDFLFSGAIAIQIVLISFKLENLREVLVLSAFHALGMGLELFKTSSSIGSWSYPEAAFFKIRTVPLYSGFMYASVASYMMQAWRHLDLKLERCPRAEVCFALCAAIYANFFTEHFIGDFRIALGIAVIIIFWNTKVLFTVNGPQRKMPLVVSFGLIGSFVWLAENFATFYGAWVYPNQSHGWSMVHGSKIGSWTLLVIISFIIVAGLKQTFPTKSAAH